MTRVVLVINSQALFVIKSTVPVGFTAKTRSALGTHNFIFSPEFPQEGKALNDNIYLSRIIVGEKSKRAKKFARLLRDGAIKHNTPVLLTESTEQEARALFVNTYLAMRVDYFNELDTYPARHGLNNRQIIDRLCLNPCLGNHHNNPSFGCVSHCLPEDAKPLFPNYHYGPQDLNHLVVKLNTTRKDWIADKVLRRRLKLVSVYRLIMKAGSDHFRAFSIQEVMKRINAKVVESIVHGPALLVGEFFNSRVVNYLETFKREAGLIIANWIVDVLAEVDEKVYSRDLFGGNG